MRLLSSLSGQVSLAEIATERDIREALRSRVALLAGRDRALATMYLEGGSSFAQIAQLTGLRRSSVARRIRRIMERLHDETYLTCVRQRSRFTEQELEIIRDHFVRGLSVRQIARERSLSYYRVQATTRNARQLAFAQAFTEARGQAVAS